MSLKGEQSNTKIPFLKFQGKQKAVKKKVLSLRMTPQW